MYYRKVIYKEYIVNRVIITILIHILVIYRESKEWLFLGILPEGARDRGLACCLLRILGTSRRGEFYRERTDYPLLLRAIRRREWPSAEAERNPAVLRFRIYRAGSGAFRVVGALRLSGGYLATTQSPGLEDALETKLGLEVELLCRQLSLWRSCSLVHFFWLIHIALTIATPLVKVACPYWLADSRNISVMLLIRLRHYR